MKLFTIVLIIGFVQVAVSETVGGECGENTGNCTWTYDTESKKLMISGNGEMTSTPWNSYKEEITTVEITGVTTISEGAFGSFKL